MNSNRIKTLFLVTGAIAGWTALLLQFYLIINNRIASVPETIIRYFSYYTILTNILVACGFTALLLNSVLGKRSFFTRPGMLAATSVYIIIVGVIYNLVLRYLWQPVGLQRLVDELLHTFIPILFVLYWFKFANKSGLEWNNIFQWLIYPLVYLIFILCRGYLSGFYPYPFVNVIELGFTRVLINSGVITVGFILLSLLMIAAARSISARTG